MKWLNYHHLYYFRTIAQEGGIARAAKKLRLGQPTLSTQLKQLESTLDQTLFERKNRSLVLTEAGKVALEYANDIFQMGSELIQVLDDKTFTNKMDVKIGVMDSIPKHLSLQLMEEALKQGNCTITILEGRGDELFRELFAHQLDLIISNYSPLKQDIGKTFSRSIANLPISVFGSSQFASLKKGFPNSLEGAPFILPTVHSKLRHDLDHYFEVNKLHPKCIAEVQDTSLQKLLAIKGFGLIALPEFAAELLVKEKKLARIGALSQVREEFWLISADRKIRNPIASELMKAFKL